VFFFTGVFTLAAQDLIILRDGNVIEAKVTEISPTEIRYKRADNLNGPTIVILRNTVLSIRYENGIVEVINASPSAGQTDGAGSYTAQLGEQTPLQMILNALPPISIAGNSLKFQFGGDNWITSFNGENFSTGTIEFETTDDGVILTLRQTHIWPAVAAKAAGRVANMVPGGAAVGGVLDTAGSVAGAVVGIVEASGPVIVLEYKAGPPAKLTYSRRASERSTRAAASEAEMTDKFDLDGINVFALSPNFMFGAHGGGFGPSAGLTLTLFEGYKPNVFFTPSFFLSGKYIDGWYGGATFLPAINAGVLFKHRFPKDRVLWNLGASLEGMFVYVWGEEKFDYTTYENSSIRTDRRYAEYRGFSFLFGMGIQTGFQFRLSRIISLDLNGVVKFPFGTVEAKPDYWLGDEPSGLISHTNLPDKSIWPFSGGIELGLTFWIPKRSRR
jgi:hypothetical protein